MKKSQLNDNKYAAEIQDKQTLPGLHNCQGVDLPNL
jgi:hypothetical protein